MDPFNKHTGNLPPLNPQAVLQVLPDPILVVNEVGQICFFNAAAEQFFYVSRGVAVGRQLSDYLPFGSPVLSLVDQAIHDCVVMAEYDLEIASPRLGTNIVDVSCVPFVDPPNLAVVTFRKRALTKRVDTHASSRAVWRSVTGMAAVLAHEVKNPLSGIRGAAQLLEGSLSQDDQTLTDLIQDETDRICAMVDRMEVFSEKPVALASVNIHTVLDHVQRIAQSGFARHIRFVTNYDPSLPPVLGHRDQLIQVLLNLVKNAAEVVPEDGGVITLGTAFRHGARLTLPGSGARLDLPLEITVQDNGPGIPDSVRDNLFEPFVSSKAGGQGLGMALVAKIIGDHGGTIDFETMRGRTVFRVRLALAQETQPQESQPQKTQAHESQAQETASLISSTSSQTEEANAPLVDGV